MINLKRVFEMARKWRSKAASRRRQRRRRRQTSLPRNAASDDHDYQQKSKNIVVAQKGHFVVYSIDKQRFEVPLQYLNNEIFKELLKMSQEEFGLPTTGPIMLPCDAVFMELALSSLVLQQKSSQKCSMCSFDRQEEIMLLVPGF
ncbi:hypothetical protein Dsin_003835 [Dipteronia sinensis]|uniref:Small auxin up regulated protein n=1 Tax=Dipteronia sinensis TaxID=43782 RepID=A0AAE0EL13_9ROSI|nr:hypothetical protein Dsin_003835 [Dipteronia sinensis]